MEWAIVTVASELWLSSINSSTKYVKKREKESWYTNNNYICFTNVILKGSLLNKMLNSYQPQLCSKKWCWNLFENALNMAIIAKVLSKGICLKNSQAAHLEFCQEFTTTLLQPYIYYYYLTDLCLEVYKIYL